MNRIPRWIRISLCFMPLAFVWALANPMFGMNDEPAHMIRAQGVVRGDFKDPYTTDGLPGEQYNCVFWQAQTADCMDLTWMPDGTVQSSPTNNYPPLFHLVTGIPSLIFSGLSGAYIMRLWLALICSLVLGWAIDLLLERTPSRFTLVATTVGVTPMLVFCMSGVAPSGLSTVTAAALWAGGLGVFSPSATTNARRSQMTFGIAALLFPFLRRDAFLWEMMIVACLAGSTSLVVARRLLRRRSTWVLLGVASFAVALVWTVWASDATTSFSSNASSHFGGSWASGLGQIYTYILMLVGCFGWNSTWMSSEMLVLVLCTCAVVLFIGFANASRHILRSLSLVTLLFFVSPVVIGAVRAYYMQGRYLFPLWIGIFVLAGQAFGSLPVSSDAGRRIFRTLVIVQVIYQFFAFAQNQRRYVVGARGTWRFLNLDGVWSPPMMSNLATMFVFMAAMAISLICARSVVSTLEHVDGRPEPDTRVSA